MQIGELQQAVTIELRRQSRDRDLDILQQRDAQRVGDGDRGEDRRHAADGVADPVRHADRSMPDRDPDQRAQVEQDLEYREENDHPERPVEQDHDRAREFGREDRAGREAAPTMVLRREQEQQRDDALAP